MTCSCPNRAYCPICIRRAAVLEGGHANGSLQAVVAQVRAEDVEVDFYRPALDARGCELGFFPGSGVEVDIVGVLVGQTSGNGGFPDAVFDQQRGSQSGGFPFAVGVAGGDGADDGADLAGVDQAALDPQARSGAFGADCNVGVVIAADVRAGWEIAAKRSASLQKGQRHGDQDYIFQVAKRHGCKHTSPFFSFFAVLPINL